MNMERFPHTKELPLKRWLLRVLVAGLAFHPLDSFSQMGAEAGGGGYEKIHLLEKEGGDPQRVSPDTVAYLRTRGYVVQFLNRSSSTSRGLEEIPAGVNSREGLRLFASVGDNLSYDQSFTPEELSIQMEQVIADLLSSYSGTLVNIENLLQYLLATGEFYRSPDNGTGNPSYNLQLNMETIRMFKETLRRVLKDKFPDAKDEEIQAILDKIKVKPSTRGYMTFQEALVKVNRLWSDYYPEQQAVISRVLQVAIDVYGSTGEAFGRDDEIKAKLLEKGLTEGEVALFFDHILPRMRQAKLSFWVKEVAQEEGFEYYRLLPPPDTIPNINFRPEDKMQVLIDESYSMRQSYDDAQGGFKDWITDKLRENPVESMEWVLASFGEGLDTSREPVVIDNLRDLEGYVSRLSGRGNVTEDVMQSFLDFATLPTFDKNKVTLIITDERLQNITPEKAILLQDMHASGQVDLDKVVVAVRRGGIVYTYSLKSIVDWCVLNEAYLNTLIGYGVKIKLEVTRGDGSLGIFVYPGEARLIQSGEASGAEVTGQGQ